MLLEQRSWLTVVTLRGSPLSVCFFLAYIPLSFPFLMYMSTLYPSLFHKGRVLLMANLFFLWPIPCSFKVGEQLNFRGLSLYVIRASCYATIGNYSVTFHASGNVYVSVIGIYIYIYERKWCLKIFSDLKGRGNDELTGVTRENNKNGEGGGGQQELAGIFSLRSHGRWKLCVTNFDICITCRAYLKRCRRQISNKADIDNPDPGVVAKI